MAERGSGERDGRPSDLVVRAPNHLGDVVMALPALAEAASDVMVLRTLVPLLDMAGVPGRILPLVRGFRGFVDAAGRLRAAGYRRGVLLSAAFSAALLFRAGGVRHLRGTATDGRGFLLEDPLERKALGRRHRILQYHFLLGQPTERPPRPHRLTVPIAEVQLWTERLALDGTPLVALFPGSNAPARRWEAARFREVAVGVAREGARVVVLGGPGEKELTREVARGVPGVHDAGGETDLKGLAAVLSLCDLLVTNDTGPMHLAGVVSTPTLTLWGSSDPSEVHPVGGRDVQVREGPLPCMPCKKNVCPRSGSGYVLSEARNECLRLITVDGVMEHVLRLLSEVRKERA